jgi:hypothetical protein
MSTDLIIASEGSSTDGTYIGGSTNYTNLNDWSDSTYLRAGGENKYYYHSFNMQDFSVPYTSISGVSMTFRINRATISNFLTPYVLIDGTKYYGADYIPNTPTTYITSTFNSITDKNPATNSVWTSTTLNNAEWGMRMYGISAPQYYSFTYDLKITVTSTAVSPLPSFFRP